MQQRLKRRRLSHTCISSQASPPPPLSLNLFRSFSLKDGRDVVQVPRGGGAGPPGEDGMMEEAGQASDGGMMEEDGQAGDHVADGGGASDVGAVGVPECSGGPSSAVEAEVSPRLPRLLTNHGLFWCTAISD